MKIARFSVALGLLFAALYAGKGLAVLVPIGISDSIWGLLLLFALLVLKIVRVEWLAPATTPILRYMALFFLPICAGIIEQTEQLRQHFNALVWANFLSTVLTLLVVGWLAQKLLHKEKYDE